MTEKKEYLSIRGAREHNLKNIDIDLPLDKLVVFTGLSGSGKSTLAFDTIYAEGQRRYVESLSAYARQFLGLMHKPDLDSIHGLSPAISIEQKTVSKNPRSTVGTVTEVYDYLRLLYARIGIPHCPNCGRVIKQQSLESIVENLLTEPIGTKIIILAPVVRGRKGSYEQQFQTWLEQGFVAVEVDGREYELTDWEKIKLDKKYNHDILVIVDRLSIKAKSEDFMARLTGSVEQAAQLAEGLLMVKFGTGKKSKVKTFSQHNACTHCNISIAEIQPRLFSFNSPFGACPTCHGLGALMEFDVDLVVPDKNKSLMEGAIAPWRNQVDGWRGQYLQSLAKHYKVDPWLAFKDLPKTFVQAVLYGSTDAIPVKMEGDHSSYSFQGKFEGVLLTLKRLYHQTESEWRKEDMHKYMSNNPCPACQGKRLKPEALAVTIGEQSIYEITNLSIDQLLKFFANLELTAKEKLIAKLVLKELLSRLQFLLNVGLDYLTLSRQAGTLSGGEAQRIRLATQIGSELRGVMYILDEPSIGLHQRDNEKLIEALKRLRDLGNTVIVVEHDAETIMAADYVVDLGPGAGVHGGQVVAQGTAQQLMKNKLSITGQYLSGKQKIAVPEVRRKAFDWLEIMGAKQNNLKEIDVRIPLRTFTCITGVSGSGKSTLVDDVLYKALAQKLNAATEKPGAHKLIKGFGNLDKVVIIDQSPIGRTPRSNPATYVGFFTEVRDLFASTKEAKIRGYKVGRFSFNVAGGRCEHCQGDGLIKIEMHFLPDVYVECEKCKGKRYNQETLAVTYKGKNIAEVLRMNVEEAARFFVNIPSLANKLNLLLEVGLGYIELGQAATTLSGGEAQRIKLATELSRRATGNTLYILDEPTTGLHFADVAKLLEVLQRLVEKGNTVLVIEHNLDVIKTADWLIDLGPGGGDKGGRVIAEGTPEKIVKCAKWSATGKYLKSVIGAKKYSK
ncbi:MAG: excinuclease ABC subunit UvrA [Candidatus Buchananbacteria bacterium]